MDFKRTKITNYFLYDTPVDNLFISEYMLDAPGEYVKVYLLALMHAQIDDPIDNLAIAKKLSVSESTVDKAWDYWASLGVAKKYVKDEREGSYTVEIINLKEVVFGHCAVDTMTQTSKPQNVQLDSVDLSKLLADVQQVTGRLLEANEAEVIATWMSAFDIAPEVIVLCYKYCTEHGKSNRCKYVEKVLLDWREKDLKTAGLVLEYLDNTDKQSEIYKRIFKELGFRRNPSEPEKIIMRKWFSDLGFSLDKVLEACKKTTGISNPSINYLDTVLRNWYKETADAAEGLADSAGKTAASTYAQIQKRYEALREENARKSSDRRREIFTQIPQLGDICSQLKNCGYKLAQALLAKDSKRVDEIKKTQEKLEDEKRSLLEAEGWPINALDPIYSCPRCQDTGFLEDGTTCSCYTQFLINDRK